MTRTSFPIFRHFLRYLSLKGANTPPFSRNSSYNASKCFITHPTISARSYSLPVSRYRDVAISCSSSGKAFVFTLMPIPTVTEWIFSISQSISVRMPTSFFLFSRISLGHLMPTSTPVTSSMASAMAMPVKRVSTDACMGGISGLSRRLIQIPLSFGACHARPILPRPAVCTSATAKVPSGRPSSASSRMRSLVVSVSG